VSLTRVRYLEIEGRETTFVLTELLAVEINICEIIRGAEVDEETRVRLALVIERLLVPDCAFVEEQLIFLRVPVAGHFQRSELSKSYSIRSLLDFGFAFLK
jgi:hypothetical protein